MRLCGIACLGFITTFIAGCNGTSGTPSTAGVGGSESSGSGGNSTSSSSNNAQGGAQNSSSTSTAPAENGGSPSNGGTTAASSNTSSGGRVDTTSQGNGGVIAGGRSSGSTVSNNGGAQVGGAQSGGAPSGGAVGSGGNSSLPAGGKATGGASVVGAGGSSATTAACVDTPRTSESCADAKTWGFCTQTWFAGFCKVTCGTCGTVTGSGGASTGQGGASSGGSSSTNTTATATGGSGTGTTLPNVTGGQNAWASRYWDCCKPACGWTGNTSDPISSCDKSNNNIGVSDTARNACESGGTAFMCWSGIPRAVSDSVSYGFAAASGTNYKCGQCFQIQFDGGSHNGGANAGTTAIKGKQMIIQVVNNGGVAADQFDLLIPGGGVGALNACSNQWGSSDLGAQYGGFLAGCNGDKSCVQNKCNTIFSGKKDLLDGCTWFLTWFNAADNPTFQYKSTTCPSDFNSVMGGLNK